VNHRIIWGLVGVAAVALLIFGFSSTSAQRSPVPGAVMPFPFGAPAGRFTVAHATATQVIILDTATGQLYKASSDDFKKFSELPKVGGGFPAFPPLPDTKENRPPRKDKRRPPDDDD
jgi:hypothetical protein